jgi:hypothetical protein
MNFRTTTLLFGLVLAVLWTFGLMLAWRQSALDLGYVFPKLVKGAKADITYVSIAKEGKEYIFTKTKDGWRLQIPPHKDEIRADAGKVDSLIEEVRSARHSNDETNVNRVLSEYKLDSPVMTVTLKSADGAESKLFVGRDSEDKLFTFVNSTERSRDVLAVKHDSISNIFSDVNDFRVRRLLEASELSTRRIALEENRGGKVSDLILDKYKDKYWRIEKPPLGPADFDAASPASPAKTEPKTEQGVRALLTSLTTLRAEDFEPIGGTTLDEKKALLRIEVDFDAGTAGAFKKDKDQDKKSLTKEVLLIGDKVAGKTGDGDLYYARLANDNSVVKVSAAALEPVFAALKDPKSLRSHDIALFETDEVDAVEIFKGKDFAKLFKRDGAWTVFSPDDAPRIASTTAVPSLLTAIQGKRAIGDKDFENPDSAEKLKEMEAKFAPDKLEAKVLVWADSLKPAEKKDEKKDEKAEKAKDEKKDAKKEEKKEDKTPPSVKEGAKPVVTLLVVRQSKDKVLVKREMADTESLFFTLSTTAFDKIVPPEMALAFFDTKVPTFPVDEAFKLQLARGHAKDRETFVVEKNQPPAKKDEAKSDSKDAKGDKKDDAKKDDKEKSDKKDNAKDDKATAKDKKDGDKKADAKEETKDEKAGDWKLVEPPTVGKTKVEDSEVTGVLGALSSLHAERWVRKIGKDGLAEYGLDAPNVVATVSYKKKEGDKEETKTFTVKFGNASRRESDKKGVYAIVDGTDFVFVADQGLDKSLKDAEFRDRQVMKFDATSVAQVSVWIRSKDDKVTQTPVFAREGDKDWEVKSAGISLNLDGKRVDQLVGLLSDLRCVRYLSVKAPGPDEYRLKGASVPLKVEITMKDGKTKHVLTVGAPSEKDGPYYATSSELPDMVFLLPQATVLKELFDQNLGWFTKE